MLLFFRYEPSSKIFRRALEKYELQVFEGPPENNRERVMLAAQHLSRGDWRTCRDLVFTLKCWNLWQQYDVAAIHAVLLKRMKEVALRTYLLKFHTHYASLGVNALCGMFELPIEAVRGVLNKMIISKEFIGSWQDVLDNTPEEKQVGVICDRIFMLLVLVPVPVPAVQMMVSPEVVT